MKKIIKLIGLLGSITILSFAFYTSAFAAKAAYDGQQDQMKAIQVDKQNTGNSVVNSSINPVLGENSAQVDIDRLYSNLANTSNSGSDKTPSQKEGMTGISNFYPITNSGAVNDTKASKDSSIQSIVTSWEHHFGGTNDETFNDILNISGDSYLAVGTTSTNTYGGKDVYVVKYNNSTGISSSYNIGTTYDEYGMSVKKTTDGGYMILENQVVSSSSIRVKLIKLDSSLNLVWSKIVLDLGNHACRALLPTSDGGFIIAGMDEYVEGAGDFDMAAIKVDSNGNLIWEKKYGNIGLQAAYGINNSIDGGYILCGASYYLNTGVTSNSHFYIVKTDSSGNDIWDSTYTSNSYDDCANSVVQNSNGDISFTGSSQSNSTYTKLAHLIMYSNGSAKSAQFYGSSGINSGYSIMQTTDGGYIIGGNYYWSSGNNSDAYLIKTDSSGNYTWTDIIGGTGNETVNAIIPTSDGGYVAAGSMSSNSYGGYDGYIFKVAQFDPYPTISSSDPISGATNIAVNKSISITFSENILQSSYYNSISLVDSSGNSIGLSKSISGCVLTLTPTVNMDYSKQYTLTIPANAVMDSSGQGNQTSTSISFTTAALTFAVSSSDPLNGATNVPVNKVISVTFNKPVQIRVSNYSILLKDSSGNSIPLTLTSSGAVVTFSNSSLNYNTLYTLTLPAYCCVQDTSGNQLLSPTTISFTTAPQALAIVSTDPINGATNVPVNKNITVTFNRPIQANPSNCSFSLKDSSNNSVPVSMDINGSVLTILNTSNLNYNTQYTLTIPANSFQDTLSQAGLSADLVMSFTTVAAAPLAITSTSPVSGATNVTTNSAITVTFTKAIQAGASYNNISLKNSTNDTVSITKNISGSVMTITPSSLSNNTTYTLTVPSSCVQDSLGVSLATSTTINFTTAAQALPSSTMSVDKITTKSGSTVTIKVNLSANSGMSSGSFVLQYDNTKVTPKSIAAGTLLQGSTFIPNISYSANQIKAAWLGSSTVNNAGDLCSIVFDVKSGLSDQTTNLDLSQPVLSTFNPVQNIPCIVSNGCIYIRNIKMGDVNGDNSVDLSDAVSILRYYVGLDTFTDAQKQAADVTKDGSVDLSDAVKILRYYVGLETTLE